MVAQELKLNPQEIRAWDLSDLVDIVADILTRSDTEAYEMFVNSGI